MEKKQKSMMIREALFSSSVFTFATIKITITSHGSNQEEGETFLYLFVAEIDRELDR